MKILSWTDFTERFVPEVHDALLQLRNTGDGLLLFENLQLDSSLLGACTAIVYGPDKTYTSIESATGQHINDLPSQRQYPTAYTTDTQTDDKGK